MDKQCDQVVVVLAAPPSLPSEGVEIEKQSSAKPSDTLAYDAFIYTNLKPSGLTPVDAQEAGQLESIGELPLVGKEQVIVDWSQHRNYVWQFYKSEKDAHTFLRPRKAAQAAATSAEIFVIQGHFLTTLLDQSEPKKRATQVWWHSEIPELVALPWELMVHARPAEPAKPKKKVKGSAKVTDKVAEPFSLSFTRGLPPQTLRPRIPVSGPLRIAFIHDPRLTSQGLATALQHSLPGIEVTEMTGVPREALQRAAAEGYEIIHLVADGSVSLANDGILHLRKTLTREELQEELKTKHFFYRKFLGWMQRFKWDGIANSFQNALEMQLGIDQCSPTELSEILRGSRVSVLSLSAPKTTKDEGSVRLAGYLLPKVYRAFCSLGSSPLPLPTIVSPVGATDDPEMSDFWRRFYTALGEHLEIRSAMAAASQAQPPVAMALFLRQTDGAVFETVSAEERETAIDPMQLDAALQLSRELVEQLMTQFEQSDLPESFKQLLSKETERQTRLKVQLTRWTQTKSDTQL